MIKLEAGMLVLDSPCSKEDAEAVGEFAKYVKDQEQERILKLIRDRVAKAKEYASNGQVTAMQRPVSWDDLYAISEAIIYGIKGEEG
jgi:hypothetical protein